MEIALWIIAIGVGIIAAYYLLQILIAILALLLVGIIAICIAICAPFVALWKYITEKTK